MRARTAGLLTLLTAAFAVPVLAGFAGTDLFIPMAGRGVGAYPSNWFTTVYLYNPNATAVSVDLSFLERNKDNVAASPPKVTDTLAPGETKVYENIVEATFGKTAYGAIRIQCGQKVVASTRVYSKESADAPLTQSFGQDFAATPAAFAIGLGEASEILGGYTTQPYQDSQARFNIGCVETTGIGSATVRWIARDAAGQEQKHYDRTVPRLSQTQGFFHNYFTGVDLTTARISANVIAGSGRVICYGSLVTNDQEFPKPVQDPTTFEMVYPEKLLGIATVQHDATLTGDGTASSLLGLADGAVTDAKVASGIAYSKLAGAPTALPPSGLAGGSLSGTYPNPGLATGSVTKGVLSATGGTAGQVLGTDGTGLVWRAATEGDITAVHAGAGLSGGGTSGEVTLGVATPLALSGSTVLEPTLSVSNTSSGNAVRGTCATNCTAIEGMATTWGSGVYGVVGPVTSWTGGVGVQGYGWVPAGRGVLGQGTTEGVSGQSDSGNGVSGQSQTGAGVFGYSLSYVGVYGTTLSGDGVGVQGIGGSADGVRGESSGTAKSGVYGVNSNAGGFGLFGRNSSRSTTGYLGGEFGAGGTSGRFEGYLGYSDGGVFGKDTSSNNWGYLGMASYAGYFNGPLRVSGLSGGGDVYADANGVLVLAASDGRLKTGVVGLQEELDVAAVLSGLRGVAFTWDASQGRARDLGGRRQIGLIAQEVEAVLPYIVGETADGYKTLDYAKLTALLIEVAKLQQSRIDALEARLAVVEGR